MTKPNDAPGNTPQGQAEEAPSASPPLANDASVAAVRPFLDVHNAYCRQLNEGWQSAQQGLKDAYSAHAKAQESLRAEVQQSVAETARQYEEGRRTALQGAPEDRQRAAVGACSHYHSDVSLAQTAAARKWMALQKDIHDTIRTLRQSYADRCRSAYQSYLTNLKQAWQSVDVEHLDATVLAHINRLTDHAMRYAWYTRAA